MLVKQMFNIFLHKLPANCEKNNNNNMSGSYPPLTPKETLR